MNYDSQVRVTQYELDRQSDGFLLHHLAHHLAKCFTETLLAMKMPLEEMLDDPKIYTIKVQIGSAIIWGDYKALHMRITPEVE